MGTKGVAATAAWVCQVSKGLREVHSTGCWWGIGILPPITFARLLSLKEKKVTNLQYRLQKHWSFSQINLFLLYDLKHWHSIRVSHPNPASLTLTQGMWVREKTSLAPDLLFDCLHVNVLDYPKIWFVLQPMTNCECNGTWLQCQDSQCDPKESFYNNNVLFACSVILHDESQDL